MGQRAVWTDGSGSGDEEAGDFEDELPVKGFSGGLADGGWNDIEEAGAESEKVGSCSGRNPLDVTMWARNLRFMIR